MAAVILLYNMNDTANSNSVSNSNYHNYFKNRTEAGEIIAEKLTKYRYDDTIVLALNESSVPVAAAIASKLHSLIAIMLTKDIFLPDGKTIVGEINEVGGFIYNNSFSTGEIEELVSEYRGSIELAKLNAMHEMHVALGQGGIISNAYFRDRVVIVVYDGSMNGMAFDMAESYLRRIKTKKIVMVCAVASVAAVDKMHVLADDLVCLNVTESTFDVNHYFDDNTILKRNEIISILNNIILNWDASEHNHG